MRSPSYRNQNKKQDALKLIANKFNTDINEISRNLHNLRSQFMQEIKKMKIKKSGAGSDEEYISNWPYFSEYVLNVQWIIQKLQTIWQDK